MPNQTQFKTREDYLVYYRNYRDKNREKFRTYNRIYNKQWRKDNDYFYDKKYAEENPEKIKAKNQLNWAVKSGKVEKEPCEICGDSKSQGHHDDYNKPSEVRWLCALCHTHLHLVIETTKIDWKEYNKEKLKRKKERELFLIEYKKQQKEKMIQSIYQKKEIAKLKQRAIKLYKSGLSLRDVGRIVGKSHEWVRLALKEIEGVDKSAIDNS